MATLEELKALKREIEEQIRMLSNTEIVSGLAKFEQHDYRNGLVTWCVRVKCHNEIGDRNVVHWQKIIENEDRNRTIADLDTIIGSLLGLRKKIEGENDG